MTTPQHAKRVSVDVAGIAPGTHRVVEYGRPVRLPASKPLTIHPVSREGSRAVIEFTSS